MFEIVLAGRVRKVAFGQQSSGAADYKTLSVFVDGIDYRFVAPIEQAKEFTVGRDVEVVLRFPKED